MFLVTTSVILIFAYAELVENKIQPLTKRRRSTYLCPMGIKQNLLKVAYCDKYLFGLDTCIDGQCAMPIISQKHFKLVFDLGIIIFYRIA